MYLPGWVNVDLDPKLRPDLVCSFNEVHTHFSRESVDEILMLHSISYLNLWEARTFFKNVFKILKDEGTLTMEFPDAVKCAEVILKSEHDSTKYLEGVRGLYAFDLGQIENEESYYPYVFGWSGWFMKEELLKIGFKSIQILLPETHGKRDWRDTRIVAKK